jgi:DNA-binding NarL/FixJ family response regulator
MSAAGPSTRIRVLIADDHRLVREALRSVLAPECEVVAEADSGESAIALTAQTKPHVVLLDIGMPGMGGLAAAHHIRRRTPQAKVLILSQYDDEEYVLEALNEAGVAGYLLKTDAASELLAAVRAVHAGRRYLGPSAAPVLLRQLKRPPAERSIAGPRLTRREREVLRLIGEGLTTKEIAQRLRISPKTAQVHRDNLKHKLDARSTAAMVRYAIKHKLVRLD